MFAYYRSSSYSTVIQRILRGSIASLDSSDVVLVKGNALAWLSIGSVSENNPVLLSEQLEQSTFGIINDAQLMPCHFDDQQSPQLLNMDYEDVTYAKKVRQHSTIEGRDIVVALSECGKLVFMTIIADLDQNIKRFETVSEVYLASPGLEYTKLGKKLAIDPHGRAIAVASFQDTFDIFIMSKSMSRTYFDPIMGRGSEIEEGIIWHMEFLYTETDSMDRILLVLVIYNDVERLCRLVIYAIDASDPQHVIMDKVSRLPLEKNTPLPLLLIPLKFQPESFMLVTEQQVCLLTADDLACGNVLYPTSIIPRQFGSIECPLFTAYTSHLDPLEDYVYLGSAEGCLFKLQINLAREFVWHPIESTSPIGQSMCMLGTIDMLGQNDDQVTADIVLYAGESADNLVLAISHEQSDSMIRHTTIQSLINRAPLTDVQVADNYRDHQDALIACSGQDEHGALSIITSGIETTMLSSSDKAEWKGVSRSWSIVQDSTRPLYLVTSSMLDTRLLNAKDGQIKDITFDSNIKPDTETLYVSSFTIEHDSFVLQVYPQGLTVFCIEERDATSFHWSPMDDTDFSIQFATSWQVHDGISVALCIVSKDMFKIQIVNIVNDTDLDSACTFVVDQISSKLLQTCPSYIGYFDIKSNNKSRSVLVVGTFSPSLLFFSVDERSLLQIIQEVDLSSFSSKEFTVVNSATLLASSVLRQPVYLIAGLRQGDLFSFKINHDPLDEAIVVQQPYSHNIGSRAVKLLCGHSGVYALCEQLWRLTCSSKDRIQLEQVLLPKFDRFMNTIAPLDCDVPLLWNTGESFAVFANDRLYLFQLSLESKINTNKIYLGQTPKKVLYDKSLNYIIAITTAMDSGKRKNFMRLIDPSNGQPLSNSQLLWTDTGHGQSEVVYSIAEWSLKNNNKLYKYLCIGIGHPEEESRFSKSSRTWYPKKETGTMILFRLKAKRNTSSDSFALKQVWTQEKLPGSVYSVCPHSAGLLFSAGAHLYLYRLDTSTGKLIEVAHKLLHSTITSIHGDGERICVTCHNDESISFYRFDSETGTLHFLKSDVASRSVHHSLVIDNRLAVGVSHSGGMVALYDDPSSIYEKRLECLFSFHYSDVLVSPNLALLGSHNELFYTNQSTPHILPWSLDLGKSNTTKPIVACTVSGGILHVYRISSPLYNLFCVLQDLLLDFEPTRPLLGSTEDFKHWYCQLSGGEKSTIHGDLVESFLRLSFDEQLRLISQDDSQIKPVLMHVLTYFFKEEVCIDQVIMFIKNILSYFAK